MLRRLEQADEMLPRRLGEHPVDVAVALDVVRWRGMAPDAAPGDDP